MVTFFEASVNFMGLHNPTLPQRVHATISWVRRSCEADLLPAWCVPLVLFAPIEEVKQYTLDDPTAPRTADAFLAWRERQARR